MKIVVVPVFLLLTLAIWICVGLVYVSGLVLGLLGKVQDLKYVIQDRIYS